MGDCHRARRFFAADLTPARIELDAGEPHHALHVLRLAAGAEVELFDGNGGTAAGRIVEVGRAAVAVAIESRSRAAVRPGPHVHLAFAVPKGRRLDWLLEKATELAAASLRPVVFERSVAGARERSPGRRRRWLGHCIAAAKQSGLGWLPVLCEPATLAEVLASAGDAFGVLGSAAADAAPLADALARRADGQDVCLLIGPEGGLTPAETRAAAEAGFRPARLGHTTLRIETAAVALLAATVALCRDRQTEPQ
jgi:16S rRNA (uracil1498-N3)-methyltransferase